MYGHTDIQFLFRIVVLAAEDLVIGTMPEESMKLVHSAMDTVTGSKFPF